VGVALGTASESYGTLADGTVTGPSMVQAAAGVLASFARWKAGAAIRLGLRETPAGAGGPDVVNGGAAADAGGVWFNGSLDVPVGGPGGPAALAGLCWPVSETFDIRAAYALAFAKGVGTSMGSSVRAGVSFRSEKGLGMDYTLMVPLSGGLGVTHLIGVGWSWGLRPRTLSY
jgi:hypothetical protein